MAAKPASTSVTAPAHPAKRAKSQAAARVAERAAESAGEVVIHSGGKRIVVAIKSGADGEQIRRSVEVALSVGKRLDSAATRLQTSVDDVISYLDNLGLATPTGAATPGSGLTQAEEDVLREAGSLQAELPSLAQRPSTVSAETLQRMLAGAFSAKDAAPVLALTPGRIRQMIGERTIFAVRGRGGWRLPRFQFVGEGAGETRLMRGLDKVLPALPQDVHPLVVQAFLEQPHVDLDIDGEPQAPRDWLESGGSIEKVLELARDLHRLP